MNLSDELKKNLGANIKRYRRQKGKSMEDFAEEICIARSTLQEMEAGRSNPRLDTLEVISKSLDVSPQLLLSSPSQIEMYAKEYALLEQIQAFAQLPEQEQREFIEKFLRLAELLNLGHQD